MIVMSGEMWKNISRILGKYKLSSIIMVAMQKYFSRSRKLESASKLEERSLHNGRIVTGSFPCLKFLYNQCYSLRLFQRIKVAVLFNMWHLDSKNRITMTEIIGMNAYRRLQNLLDSLKEQCL